MVAPLLVLLLACFAGPVEAGWRSSLRRPANQKTSWIANPPDCPPDGVCNTDVCNIGKNWTQEQVCCFVNCNDDACEGGGYFLWSQYVVLIVVAVIYMLVLFVMVSSAADDFFSPSVSAIVAHLKISESVAGVTFMAFGNGAPDVFGSIASVLSSPTPKAGLALGELFGGGLFVTTMVTSTIILTKPFKVEVFSTVRDLVFYLFTIAFLLFCFMFSSQVYLWMPLSMLGIYAVYVVTVVVAQAVHQKRKKRKRAETGKSLRSRAVTVIPNSTGVPEIQIISEAVGKIQGHVPELGANENYMKRASVTFSMKNGIAPFLGPVLHPLPVVTPGGEDDEAEDEEFVVVHHQVFTGAEARSRAASVAPEPRQVHTWKQLLADVADHLNPMPDPEEFREANIVFKALSVVKIIPTILFKLTIPLNETSWSKAMAMILCATCPQFLLFAVQMINLKPFDGSPGLWAYALGLSVILITLVSIFTTLGKEPKFYKEVYSYAGFLMAIAWIYLISSEVVNVVTMLGVVSKISHEVLGLTILAWSNSIGDLIADVSVVKQGYPRMAMAAAIGGPLFNLLMGFGLPFTIARARGKYIPLNINPIYRLLMLFLTISLGTTLLGVFIQRYYLRRPHAVVLMSVYATFLVFVALSETNVLVWN
ncbi:unnamed protein product [Caenorhabditis auriculariae]|uniref:Sodium/calcium exchanger membrane region domain-containing protein n=1 Tax=Caenorhabditis auriculariae TaxID=2777116 RepID=A0A8S1H500_9PELO|nr:unnamed protein product [Caenorhabditis auriculariae]